MHHNTRPLVLSAALRPHISAAQMTSFVDPMHAFFPPGDETDACDFGLDPSGDMGLFGGVDDPLDFSRQGMQQALMLSLIHI